MILYIYGIIDSNISIDEPIRGLEGERIYNISFMDIGIVASNFKGIIKDITKTHVLVHEYVMERLMKKFTVLPFRFRTLFNKEEDVLSLIRGCYIDVRENLNRLNNKAEFGIKVIWSGDKIKEQIERDLCKREYNLHGGYDLPEKRFIEEKFEKYKIDKEYGEKADICISIVDNFFNRFAAEKKIEKLKSKDLLLNAFYLVENEKQGDFKKAFGHLKSAPGDFKYLLSGPWPPYNFVNINL
ncbi:MAG: GvpL/GvpF family gas vesicle protein [Nitrospirae bacterium]|nr:GvpL/GvpF family gas vesicle protein [Nitrospirota bacterium]